MDRRHSEAPLERRPSAWSVPTALARKTSEAFSTKRRFSNIFSGNSANRNGTALAASASGSSASLPADNGSPNPSPLGDRRKRASANWRRLTKEFVAKAIDRVGEEETLEQQITGLAEWLENIRNNAKQHADTRADKGDVFNNEDLLRVST